jgi:hypothetical protein
LIKYIGVRDKVNKIKIVLRRSLPSKKELVYLGEANLTFENGGRVGCNFGGFQFDKCDNIFFKNFFDIGNPTYYICMDTYISGSRLAAPVKLTF